MQYQKLPEPEILRETVDNLTAKNYQVITVENKEQALEKIRALIPAKASVMNGSSVTLEEIGYIEYLKSGKHPWNNLHAAIVAEKDPDKQAMLRQQGLHSNYYLGSVHALLKNGEFIVASNTGSQLPHISFTSPNLVFVVGTQKIVNSFEEGMERLEKYVVPLEDTHMQEKYGVHTCLSKVLYFRQKSPALNRSVTFILVNEKLGF